MKPKVSVIIPLHNYGQYIEQAILSVLVQKFDFKIEIIISDDFSTDNGFEIAQRVGCFYQTPDISFTVVKSQEKLGEIANTKKLLELSQGEYIAYLDADDWWISPTKLSTQVKYLDENPEVSLTVTGWITLDNNNEFIPTSDFSTWLCPIHLDSESLVRNNFVGSSSSRVFRNIPGLFKDYFTEFPYSDWPLNFELSLLGEIRYLNFPGYVYRTHERGLQYSEVSLSDDLKKSLYEKRSGILQKRLLDKIANGN